jgi:hypothetical protein
MRSSRLRKKKIRLGQYDGYTSTYAVEEMESTEKPKSSDMLALFEKYPITVLDVSLV